MRTLATLLLLAAAVHAQSAIVRLEERKTSEAQPHITFPQFRLDLTAKRPSDLRGVPKLSPAARYALTSLGGRSIALAFDAPPGALALGFLYAGGGKPHVGRARTDPQNGSMIVDFDDVAAPGTRVDVHLYYRGTNLLDAILQPTCHRRGRTALAGNLFEVILVDADADGAYNGARDRWVALRVVRLHARPKLRRAEALLLDEPLVPFERDGRAFMIERVAKDGSQCVFTLGQPAKSQRDVLDRRYREVRAEHFRRLAREAKRFRAKHDLDRPRVKKRAAWRTLPLSEARALAAREKKPLLVFFMTETNPWCFRYEYYTFPDREVDEILRKFVLVRIDAEKDAEKSFQGTGARVVPTLLPFTADGKRIRFTQRNRDAEGHVADLAQPDEMISGWQRPQELVVNLRRILEVAR